MGAYWMLARRCVVVVLCLWCASVSCLQPELLKVPQGFSISVWRTGITKARQMAAAKVGDATIVYVGSIGDSNNNAASDVHYVVDSNSDGTPDFSGTLLSGLETPNGVAVQGSDLFVSGFENGKGMIWRLRDVHTSALQNKPFTGTKEVVTDKLPGDKSHGRRYLRFSPSGQLVLGVGMPCNICPPRKSGGGIWFGSLYALDVATGDLQQLAAGIRNSAGHDFRPTTGELYFGDAERDNMGDDSPDCELNRLPSQASDLAINSVAAFQGLGSMPNFGFPYCLTQGLGNPYQRDLGAGRPLPDPDQNPNGTVIDCSAPSAYIQPVQAMGPHTTPLGMRFYRSNDGPSAFPSSYNNALFIVQRGSWNRALKIGYRVMMLKLDSGVPQAYEEFATGWLQNVNQPENYAWGRPNDVEQLPDGSLLISDDESGALFRITYGSASIPATSNTTAAPTGSTAANVTNTSSVSTAATGSTPTPAAAG